MNDVLYYILCSILSIFILVGIYLMSKVKSARVGNLLSAFATLAAVIITVIYYDIISQMDALIIILVTILIGLLIGAYLAKKVKMIQMPELVALLNGVGGAASSIVGAASLFDINTTSNFNRISAIIALIIGMLTLTGSLIAAGKLSKIIKGKPITLKYHTLINVLLIILIIITSVLTLVMNYSLLLMVIILAILSGLFGVVFAIRVGGADMPITISLLNSLSGVAGAVAGMAIDNVLLVAVGGIVGSSGLVLTQIMCNAMNRNLADILLGKTSVSGDAKKVEVIEQVIEKQEQIIAKDEIEIEVSPVTALKNAKKVIIVPGYGMALAQAQQSVKELADLLENNNAIVKYAIHPVAGRMPGHMNVLLAEVDVDYDKLYEMDSINDEFKDVDVTIVIGANDVLNPAARNAQGTPIYGMPILNVDQSKYVIICNYDTKPGYAGVDNPLYQRTKGISLLLGDAKETLSKLISEFK